MGGNEHATPGRGTRVAEHLVGQDVQRPGKSTLITGQHRHRSARDELPDRVQDAASSYQAAIQNVRMDTLAKKDSDLPWLAGLVLDVLGKHVGGVIERLLKAPDGQPIKPMLQAIQGTAKATVEAVKKAASSGLRASIAATPKTAKQEQLDYLSILQDEVFVAYAALREDLSAGSDEEIIRS